MKDYRETDAGKRRFANPEIYQETVKFQDYLKSMGIAWHNPFSNECTIDFACCMGDRDYHTYFPSYGKAVEQFTNELFEHIKHGNDEHKEWLKTEIKVFFRKYFQFD